MDVPTRRQFYPAIDHLSILAAMIVLAYTLERFIDLPGWQISRQLPGLYVEFTIDASLVTTLLVACMTFAGANWLMREHPSSQGKLNFEHAILPALTALVIGIPLGRIPLGLTWWIGLISGAILLVLVLLAEYIAVDPDDIHSSLAIAALSATSFALFLVLAAALRSNEVRLLFIVPLLVFAAWLVSLRVMHLRLHGEWTLIESAIVAFLIGQFTAAFNYWPLTPVAFGLFLLGPTYALISLFCNLIEGKRPPKIILEPVISIVVAWMAALILR